MGHADYSELLDALIAVRDAPYHSDPERDAALLGAHTHILQATLEKLRDYFEPSGR